MTVEVNYLAVLVGAVINMIIGSLWYGPVFGKQWQALMGWGPERMAQMKAEGADKGMWKKYLVAFVGGFVMSFVLWHSLVFAIGFMQEGGVWKGVEGAFWNWLGFVVPVILGTFLWEGKSFKLFVLNIGYYLVSLVMVGAVLAAFM